jgi:RNA polymerase sigma-70 factor, ECF subfamily
VSEHETVPSEATDRGSADVPVGTTAALFERAVREHSRRLLAIARAIIGNRAAPEDVVQQALTNLYQHRDRYDWREPGGLMRRSVVNESLRVLRQPRMTEVTEQHPGRPDSPMGGMIDRETILRVQRAIDRLPEHFRAALVLCEYENMAYAQIAQVLGASIPQVKTWLHRGRRQLAATLQEFGPARNLLPAPPKAGTGHSPEESRR